MKYDILPPIGANILDNPDWLVSFAQAAERLGFNGISTSEHTVWVENFDMKYFPYGDKIATSVVCPFLDPIDMLAFIAGATTSLELGTQTVKITQSHPVYMAKRLATLDVLAKGRLRLGIGIGWNREEMEVCGEDYTNRGARANEAIELMRLLWAGDPSEPAEYHGKHYDFSGVYCNPKPVNGYIKFFVGGHTEAAATRAGRLGEGFQPLMVEGEKLDKLVGIMRAASLEVILRRSMDQVTPESLAEDEAHGVTRLIVSGKVQPDLNIALEELEAFSTRMGLPAPAPV
jgi:probable F420-dependent oxidoreductase